jgi:hypothetical protein
MEATSGRSDPAE